MKTVVCVRQAPDGELNPFDACAYEAALQIPDNEVMLLSMASHSCRDFLQNLTRLGAKNAYLLCDDAFRGADTLATGYTLAKAIEYLSPDLVICGRQTLNGDTGQTGVGIAENLKYSLITNVMSILGTSGGITCTDRAGNTVTASYPALITVERINNLRLPSIRSKTGEVIMLTAADIGADVTRTGLSGSPTRVLETYENEEGRRRCAFITPGEFTRLLPTLVKKELTPKNTETTGKMLKNTVSVTEKPLFSAKTVSDDITVLPLTDADTLAREIEKLKPTAVFWASDMKSKRVSSQVAVKLGLGLCADCTAFETDGKTLYMYRPAFSGNIIAKIKSLTVPSMATVRTPEDSAELIFSVGRGAADYLDFITEAAKRLGAEITASRGAVDRDLLPYEKQVGLTGRTVTPKVYVALGISGAVHHIAGIKNSGTVIAVNTDKNAPVFDYADYGIICDVGDFLKAL